MADPAQFGHDQLGHLLSDRLLRVPGFQRRYSWQSEHVSEFWADIERARSAGDSYFMGTVVLASDPEDEGRKLIIDGQQRITTTAILIIAIRDQLRALGHERAARSLEDTYLSNYDLSREQTVAKLTLSPDDLASFNYLLDTDGSAFPNDRITAAYAQLKTYVSKLAPTEDSYRNLIDLVGYLGREVQVLLAIATGLPEAYVIFETLNDRGADLTTADLLKNYLFSQSGSQGIAHAESAWTRLTGRFDKAEDFVKFLRYEYMSRKGRVTNRDLYKALQTDIGSGPAATRRYLDILERALQRYTALREPDDSSWSSQAIEVKDSLLAFRRFGFEASTPLLLAAFSTWSHSAATRFVDVVAAWSVRAWTSGSLGGGVAESTFCDAAVRVSSGAAASVGDVRKVMKDLVPDDNTFKQAFLDYGSITTTRAKYILAQLERQFAIENDPVGAGEAMPDWSSKTVSVEHIFAQSSKRTAFESDDDFEKFSLIKDRLQNLALLERTLNTSLDDKPFVDKSSAYRQSKFVLTRRLATCATWGFIEATDRNELLADLAVRAWAR